MARKTRLSRLNPAYLVARHGGMAFLLLMLGILAGVVYMKFLAPRRVEAGARVAVRAIPANSEQIFAWEEKSAEWMRLFAEPANLRLIAGNLRHALKAAFAQNNRETDAADAAFRSELLSFKAPRLFSTSIGAFGGLAYFGPETRVSRHDIVACLDFQALARIVCDLEPPEAAAGWEELRRLMPAPGNDLAGETIGVPGPDDRFFKPLYVLYALLNKGRRAADPEAAWLAAVEEIADRLARESEYAGAGGFGAAARRELLLEFRAMPLLIANGLYDAGGLDGASAGGMWTRRWVDGWRQHVDWAGDEAVLDVAFGDKLMPLDFPQYGGDTRIEPLAVRTAIAFISARDAGAGRGEAFHETVATGQVAPLPEFEPVPMPELEPLAPLPASPPAETGGGKSAGAGTDAAFYESALRQAENQLGAAERNRRRAEDALARLAEEETRGLARQEKLRERLDSLEDRRTATTAAEDPDVACLKRERRAALDHLALLLETCTEEHPFVVAVRRDLRAIERRLAEAGAVEEAPGAWEIRLRGVKTELDAAASALAGIAERRRRSAMELDAAVGVVSAAQANVRRLESMLARAREAESKAAEQKPLDALNANLGRLTEKLAAVPAPERPRPASVAAPVPPREPIVTQPVRAVSAKLEFQAPPDVIQERELPPDKRPLYAGAALGLLAGLIWTLLRELLSFRFRSAYEARRMVDLPVLAVLPAFEPASMAVSAKAMGGTIDRSEGGRVFIPPPAELHEPPRLGKRPAVAVRGPKRRWVAWLLGIIALLLVLAASQADVLERRLGGNRGEASAWRAEPLFSDGESASSQAGGAP